MRGVLVRGQRAEVVVMRVDRIELGGFEVGNIAPSKFVFVQVLLISSRALFVPSLALKSPEIFVAPSVRKS